MSAGTVYSKRYAGGFLDLPTKTTPIDQQFLNAVEAALLQLIGSAPTADGQVAQWDNVNTRYGPALLLNKNIDPAAGIVKSKLDLTGANGIVNADIAGAAAIARSKLNFGAGLVDADIAAAAAISISKIANALKVTVGTFAAGPPGGPATNDIWIATDVDANGAVWCFRYNSAEATYKWEFIGGSPVYLSGSPLVVINAATQVAATGWYYNPGSMSYTTVRAGDYMVEGLVIFDPNGSGGTVGSAVFADTTSPYGTTGSYEQMIAGLPTGTPTIEKVTGIAAAKLIGTSCQSTIPGTHRISKAQTKITPVRII